MVTYYPPWSFYTDLLLFTIFSFVPRKKHNTGMPYEDPNDFPIAIGIVNEAIENYPFERFGWERSDDGPYLGMGAAPDTGARTAVPVKKTSKTTDA